MDIHRVGMSKSIVGEGKSVLYCIVSAVRGLLRMVCIDLGVDGGMGMGWVW